MVDSYPSRPVMTVDAPEVSNLNVQFVYNFFSPDEKITREPNVPRYILEKSSDDLSSVTNITLSKLPRYNFLSWSAINLDQSTDFTFDAVGGGKNTFLSSIKKVEVQSTLENLDSISIADNISKLLLEEQFSNNGFTGINFQDNALDGKLFTLMSGSIASKVNNQNLSIIRESNNNIREVARQIDYNQISLKEVAQFLSNEIGPEDLPNDIILNALTYLKQAGTRFLNTEETLELIDDTLKELKNIRTTVRVNNKFIKTVLASAATDPLGFFVDETSALLDQASEIQNKSIYNFNPSTISLSEYDVKIVSIKNRVISENTDFLPRKAHIGYLVQKYERGDDGIFYELEPIILEGKDKTSTIDFSIKYGNTYGYQIRGIYAVEFQTFSDNEDEIMISTALVASAPSQLMKVKAEETIPPPPPSDVNVFWDHQEDKPVITWSFPVNPQRDIKKWQVFRRKNIDEPFQLLVELDFDDSIIRTKNYETIDINLIRKLSSPQNYWVDKLFNKNEKYIYTVVSIDAHGLSSNYGAQFEVVFNRKKNNVSKKLISSKGAPKQYPNLYLNSDTFVDAIKDSNHSKMTIVFNPEYYHIENKGEIIATKQNRGSYKIKIINVDFQQSQDIDITINDTRKSEEKENTNSVSLTSF